MYDYNILSYYLYYMGIQNWSQISIHQIICRCKFSFHFFVRKTFGFKIWRMDLIYLLYPTNVMRCSEAGMSNKIKLLYFLTSHIITWKIQHFIILIVIHHVHYKICIFLYHVLSCRHQHLSKLLLQCIAVQQTNIYLKKYII